MENAPEEFHFVCFFFISITKFKLILDEVVVSPLVGYKCFVVENLNKFYKGRTVVVVAHRLSTVKDSDQIIVLDGGHICETGDHKTLIANKGAYYNLNKNQLELGK